MIRHWNLELAKMELGVSKREEGRRVLKCAEMEGGRGDAARRGEVKMHEPFHLIKAVFARERERLRQ